MDPGGGYGGGGGEGRKVAERWLGIAERLLGARDLVGSKRYAERAMEAEPLLDGVDQVIAVADVLIAGQRRVNNHVDWYAVLQLPAPSASADGGDAADVRRQYRRLTILLHPDRNRFSGADAAFRLVADAFAVLSDPAKKSLFDAEIRIAAAAASASASKPPPSPFTAAGEPFWTTCPACYQVHLYAREYLDLSLRCPTCRRPFIAAELASLPSVVPGTDMYYCSWGFFPLGFPGGSSFFGSAGSVPSDPNSEWKLFYPMFPNYGKNNSSQSFYQQPGASVKPPGGHREYQSHGKQGNVVEPKWAPAARKKTMARKKVGGGPKKGPLSVGNDGKGYWESGSATPGSAKQLGTGMKPINLEEEAEAEEGVVGGININEAYKILDGGVEENPDNSLNFNIDVDATEEILGNLHNLPFL